MTYHRLIAALIGLILFYSSTVFAQKADVDISACRRMLGVMKAMKEDPSAKVPSAMLDALLDTKPYQVMFKHYNRPFRPNHLPKDVFKRMILSVRYEGKYTAGENQRADSMLPHWKEFYANLPAHEANIQQLETADLKKQIDTGLRRAQGWLPPEWKIPDFYFFIHPDGGSGGFAIEEAQGHDYFRLDRDDKGALRLDPLVATIAHESHHLGLDVATPEGLPPSQSAAFRFLGLFVGEGTATKFVDNAPGGAVPRVDPSQKTNFNTEVEQAWRAHTLEERRIFERMVATFEKAYRGELTMGDLDKDMRDYWLAGVKGPAYFVGSELYGAIYTAFGKEGLFAAMRDPRKTFQLYRDALKAKPALLQGCPEIPEAVAQHALSIGVSSKEP